MVNMDILMFFNTYTQGYFVSGNERINTSRIVSTNANNFPLIITFNAINTSINVTSPLTFMLNFEQKKLTCDSPYIKILHWKDNTYELFITQPLDIIFPKPLSQISVTGSDYIVTLSTDSMTRLLVESDSHCQLFTLGNLLNPKISQQTEAQVPYVIITDDNNYLSIIQFIDTISSVIEGNFVSYSLTPNVITVSQANDTLRHLVTNTYQYTPSGLKLQSSNAESRLKPSTQQIPVCFFEAIKMQNMSEILTYLSNEFCDIRLTDLTNYFPKFDYAKIPTLINSPNTVALVDTELMQVTYVKIEMKNDKITNFEIIDCNI